MTFYDRSLRPNRLALMIAPVAVALVVAGCGGGGDNNKTPAKTGAASGATLRVANLEPGKALVDGQGRTLYLFEADKGDKSTCSGACASIWPPATATGMAAVGPGLTAAKLGTTKRGDGSTQLTYNGHPLYRYAADGKPGDTSGQGLDQFGAKWYVLNATGSKIDDD
jgi:predicted lipoprotein with Yx(FWY)xxD motif